MHHVGSSSGDDFVGLHINEDNLSVIYSYQILFSVPIPSQDKGCSLCQWRAPDLIWRAASLGKLACLYNCEKAVEHL